MNGELARCIAMAAVGGRWLARSEGEPPALDDGSTFEFVRSIEYELERGRGVAPLRATSTREWLLQLRDRGVRGLRVEIREGRRVLGLPRYHGAGFAGSDQWAVLAVDGDDAGRERWMGEWRSRLQPGAPLPEDRRIWDVRYLGVPIRPRSVKIPNIDSAQRRLDAAVDAAHTFAASLDWDPWTAWLQKARDVARQAAPESPLSSDAMPADAPPAVRRLYATAAQSWVFGGMGWWNDMGAPRGREREYDRITRTLYDAVLESLAAAANSAGR